MRKLHPADRSWVSTDMHPLGLRDMARRLLYDGRRFLACISVERAFDRPVFDARALALIDEEADVAIAHLVAAEALAQDLDGHACALLFSSTGRCEHMSPAMVQWADRDRVRILREAVVRFDSQGQTGTLFVGGARARLTRIESHQRTRYLVTVEPTVAPLMHPAADP